MDISMDRSIFVHANSWNVYSSLILVLWYFGLGDKLFFWGGGKRAIVKCTYPFQLVSKQEMFTCKGTEKTEYLEWESAEQLPVK